jgi:hypothetical protein
MRLQLREGYNRDEVKNVLARKEILLESETSANRSAQSILNSPLNTDLHCTANETQELFEPRQNSHSIAIFILAHCQPIVQGRRLRSTYQCIGESQKVPNLAGRALLMQCYNEKKLKLCCCRMVETKRPPCKERRPMLHSEMRAISLKRPAHLSRSWRC